jgi:SAM-dependent methyltransferase
MEVSMMSVADIWDICLEFEYDKAALTQSLYRWISATNRRSVLDAACGSGFPAIALAKLGIEITCCDGSALMLRQFRRNAALAGVEIQPHCLCWSDLKDHFAGRFDLVMCRGSSLIYAGGWDKGATVHKDSILEALRSFYQCLEPNGIVYIDTTAEDALTDLRPHAKKYPKRLIDGRVIELSEVIYTDQVTRTRKWIVQVAVDGVKSELERFSLYLPHDELRSLMKDAGFNNVSRAEIAGEHYAVFLGHR